jgi:ABC-type transport system involved in multi-copper enzyme maturation permease subunit
MNWLVWLQHRRQYLVMGVLLAGFAALTIPTGLHYWHAYQQALANCALNPATPSCTDLAGNLFSTNFDLLLQHLVPLTMTFLPLVLAMFWGAPLLAREYAEGTNSLVWTQSVSRRRWLTVKLLWVLVATALFVAAFSALTTWWSDTFNALNQSRFAAGFSTQDIVPVAYALFAISLGILLGAWFKKTMVAVGVVLALYIALVIIVVPQFVRPAYMSPITVTASMGPNAIDSKIPTNSWLVSNSIVDKNGHIFNRLEFPDMPSQCQALIQQAQSTSDGHSVIRTGPKAIPGDAIDNCLNNAGFHQVAKYQPANRYWPFQWIETGLFLALAALAIGGTYWLVLKRDA